MYQRQFYVFLIALTYQVAGLSYNRPDLGTDAEWNLMGVTIMTKSIFSLRGIFIDSDDTLYALENGRTMLSIWSMRNNSPSATNINIGNISIYSPVIVTEQKDVYFQSGQRPGRIIRRSQNSTNNMTVADFGGECHGLFIDINNTLYCSLSSSSKVVTKSLDQTSNGTISIRAGTGSSGSAANQLNGTWGIFVDTNFDLYVADSNNHRIQLFRLGSTNGITIVGPGTHGSFSLLLPTDVILDKDSNIYVADNEHHRIIRVTPVGVQCIVGCTGTTGSAPNQFNKVYSLRFDSFGNLFVVDEFNGRIQKFHLTSRSRVSHNQPKLCWNATWSSHAITFVDNSTVQTEIRGIFIDTDDSIYLTRHLHGDILRWLPGDNSSNYDRIISGSLYGFGSVFVSFDKEIYFETSASSGRIEKRSVNGSTNIFVIQFNSSCRGLFIDLKNNLYCSLSSENLVAYTSLNENNSIIISRAGNGSNGSAMNQLDLPWGIFVNRNLDLYVADTHNHRIQYFPARQLNGTTVAGQSFPNGLNLLSPTDVILDGNNHLYIADNNHNRIIRVSSTDFQCLVGCLHIFGSAPDQFRLTYSLRFDSYGNLYVADEYNNRLQKLLLISNCENIPHNRPQLCANSTWNETGTTFADNRTLGVEVRSIFVDRDDDVYFAYPSKHQILIWSQNTSQSNFTVISYVTMSSYSPLFVSVDKEIYFENSVRSKEIWKRSINTFTNTYVAKFNESCFGLFIDRYNTLYCSVKDAHHVATTLLYNDTNVITVRAGNGTNGSAENQLSSPWGIFVDIDFNLFVADADNNRIQMFLQNQTNGTTIAGKGIPCRLELNFPTHIVVDGNGFIYISDHRNHRIIRVGSNNYQILAANRLNQPYAVYLDSIGNLFVSDEKNQRIGKFFINPICFQTSRRNLSMDCPIVTTEASVTTEITTVSLQPTPCSVLQPCQNNGTCINVFNNSYGYYCSCVNGFDGVVCQYDRRTCRMNRCLNNGTCYISGNGTSFCQCVSQRYGLRCEKRMNFCSNTTCENQGVCRSRSTSYQCLCLGDSFSGVHCEIVSTKTKIYRITALSFACLAIIIIISFATFIVLMDILKYGFGIDAPKTKEKKNGRKFVRIVHHKYVSRTGDYSNGFVKFPRFSSERFVL